jgi:hypothetical protein
MSLVFQGTGSAVMPSAFVQYEKFNNKFIRALQDGKDFRDFLEKLTSDRVPPCWLV